MNGIDLASFDQLKATRDLPSPKGAALAIIRLTQREDTSLVNLAHAVKSDPAFVARLIKAANGVRMGMGGRPIASIQDALLVLGIPAVRSMALGFSLLSNFNSGACRNFDYARFWSHSLAFAVSLQSLVKITHAAPADEAFSIGLLAHIGELALATMFAEEYSGMLAQESGSRSELLERERATFVMTHNQLTAAMMLDWGLPKVFAEPVMHHEAPEKAEFPEGDRMYAMLWSLALADRIADICLAADDKRRELMPGLQQLAERLSIDGESLIAMCDHVAGEWREWGDLLDVHTEDVPPFEELSQPAPMPLGDDGAPMRVLVVDDEAGMRTLLRAMLSGQGHEVYEATNGQEAFEKTLEIRPDIIVLDWLMPRMDGLEFTRALRQTKAGRSVYILLLTGVEEDEKLVEAFEAGVDDFMVKPLKPRLLAARLRAGQRVINLQREVERDREEIRRFAAELAVSNRRLQEAALTDPLTGFPNRRYVIERIEQEWAASSRNKRPLSCMVIDVDNFKAINDSHGHDVGDAVLRETALALKTGLRSHDVISRIGGDEFLVVCPETDLPSALICAERMRKAVEALEVATESVRLRGSVSVGIAVRDATMDDADALIKCADRGVFLAKQRGRNRLAAVQHKR